MTLDCQFVLVNPEDPHNIGAVARCLHNLGFPQSLRLVTPKTSICDDARARYMAHTAAVVLDSAQIFPTLEEALADVDVSVGTSTRHRQTIHRYLPLPDLAQALAAKQEHDLGRIGIVFGPESTGLTSADLKLCEIISTIPMAAEQPSFNLSQAVLLYAYELSKDRVTPLVDRRFLTPTGNWRQLRKELEEVLKCLGGQSIPAEGSRRLLADLVLLPGRHLGTLHNLVRLVSARLVSEPRPRLDLDDKISEDNI